MSGIELKTPDQLRIMRRAGLVVAEVHDAVRAAAAPGVTTGDLDQIARDILARHGAGSSFLNYGAAWGYPPYPGVTCISVNEEVVHGIPGPRALVEGDLVSVDFGAIVDGFHGDASRTTPATASARPCTRPPTCRTWGVLGEGLAWSKDSCWPSNPW